MATTLITKETSHTSSNTYYKLDLDSLTRSGSNITVTLHVYITMGSSSTVGSNWNRTLYVYNSSDTQIASKVIKSGDTRWSPTKSYDYTITFNYDVGTTGAWSESGFYIRILKSPNTASGDDGSGVWDGAKSTSGGTVGQTFALSAVVSNIVHINVNGVWKDAIPYINVNGTWKEATPYINVGGIWKTAF